MFSVIVITLKIHKGISQPFEKMWAPSLRRHMILSIKIMMPLIAWLVKFLESKTLKSFDLLDKELKLK